MVAGRIHADAGATVSTEQLDFYHREGYLHLRGVLAPDLLSLTEYVLSRWVDETVAQWLGEGRIADRQQDLDFQHRLVQLWHDAGRPKYSRSPRRDLVSPEMYRILVHPVLLDVAEDLLGTPELSVHGIFNARPKLPDQIWTRTSWHQDAQYYRDAADGHVVSLWYPLQAVSERNSCLPGGAAHAPRAAVRRSPRRGDPVPFTCASAAMQARSSITSESALWRAWALASHDGAGGEQRVSAHRDSPLHSRALRLLCAPPPSGRTAAPRPAAARHPVPVLGLYRSERARAPRDTG